MLSRAQVERRTGTDIAADTARDSCRTPQPCRRGTHSDLRDCRGNRARAAETNRPSVPLLGRDRNPNSAGKKVQRDRCVMPLAPAGGSMCFTQTLAGQIAGSGKDRLVTPP